MNAAAAVHEESVRILAGIPPGSRLQASVLAAAPLEPPIRRALDSLNFRLKFHTTSSTLLTEIEVNCPDVLILDLDRTPLPEDLAKFARSLRPNVTIAVAQWYWSDRHISDFADVVLHKPVRHDEWWDAVASIAAGITRVVAGSSHR